MVQSRCGSHLSASGSRLASSKTGTVQLCGACCKSDCDLVSSPYCVYHAATADKILLCTVVITLCLS